MGVVQRARRSRITPLAQRYVVGALTLSRVLGRIGPPFGVCEMATRSLFVREEYTELTSHSAHEKVTFWRLAVGVPVLSILAVLGARALHVSEVTTSVLAYASTYCLYYGAAMWYALRREPGGARVASGAYAAAASTVVIVAYLAWMPLGDPFHFHRPASLVLALPAVLLGLNWISLGAVAQEYPRELDAVGVRLPLRKSYLLYALLGGCLVAGHYFFAGTWSDLFAVTWSGWSAALWTMGLAVGIRSLSEEIFFRGVVFNYIYWMRQGGFWTASLTAALLNMGVYLALGLRDEPVTLTLSLLSVGILAVVNAFLYRMSQSIVPSVISSALFFALITVR